MAKQSKKPVNGVTNTGGRAVTRGKATAKKIEVLADSIIESGSAHQDPSVDIPTRALSNVSFDAKKRILRMGNNKQARNFYNLSQAKKFMQTVLIASGAKD